MKLVSARIAALLVSAVLATQFSLPAAAATTRCPTSINEALVVSETDGSNEVAPSDLDRPFPDVPERLVPGGRESDALRITPIAEVPVETTLIVADGDTSVIDPDHDLHVRITWGDRVLKSGSYRDIVGSKLSLGTLEPGRSDTLSVEVELPWVDERDNDTQERRWPLRFNLGVATGEECDSNSKEDATVDDDSTTRADATTDGADDSRSTSNAAQDATTNSSDDVQGDGDLPRTGFMGGLLLVIAGAAVILGFVLVVVSRRRQRQ